jgi:N-acyl-D-aspartate/D-glutamate deacylase
MENNQPVNAEATEVNQESAPSPELTVTDLANLRAIIDVAVRRGAFGASEVAGVGATFDKLNGFLNALAPAKTEDQAAAPKQ